MVKVIQGLAGPIRGQAQASCMPLPLRLGDAASSGPGYALPLLDDAREQALGLVVPFAMQRAGPAPEPNRGAPLGRSSDDHTHTLVAIG